MKKLLAAVLLLLPGAVMGAQSDATHGAIFRVRHATEDTVYLDAGRNAGLTPGVALTIKRKGVYDASSGAGEIKADVMVARIVVVSISNASAMCEIRTRNFAIQNGDLAYPARVEDEKPAPLWTSRPAPISQPVNALPERKSLAERVRENRSEAAEAARTASSTRASLAELARANIKKRSQQAGDSDPAEKSSATPPPAPAAAGSAPVTPPATAASPSAVATVTPVSPAPPATAITPAAVQPAENLTAAKPGAAGKEAVSARTTVPAPATAPTAPTASLTPGRIAFTVKYVAQDAVYIDGGKNAGLAEGMALSIQRSAVGKADQAAGGPVAELAIVSVSSSSAVCEIRQKTAEIQRGDVAMLSQPDQDKMVQARTLSPDRKYPQVIAFSEGDPLDEEARENVPRPPLPEVNRARGRIGFDYSSIRSSVTGTNSGSTNSIQTGGVVRIDMSRIAGSYWNLNGYWRGRMNLRNSSTQAQTVYDLVNRTYTIGLTYANPQSRWVAGAGRLYLPWATSLDTTDGGYLARRFGSHVTLGVFGGTAPDPTSFDYNPDRQTGGTFIAFEGGSFENVRFTSTEGVAVTGIDLREDRQFIFSENGLFFRKFLSIYQSSQADRQRLPLGGTAEGLSRSFTTVRIQPLARLSFDVNHNYFRDVPTFDPLLVGTGLLDKFLFQGLSAGARLELPGHISVYNNFGQSNKSGDAHSSFNQLYGVTIGRLWKTGIRGDVRYSQFSSSFGRGDYRALALSRSFRELLRIEVTAGKQNFVSSLGTPTDYQLAGATMDWNLGHSYFFESGFNWQKGTQQTFEQWFMTMGYRFDSGRRRR